MTTKQTFMYFHRLFCLSALLLLARFGNAQENLIVNPNCDIYDTCPDNTKQIARANGWWKFDFFGTPDYINECSDHPRVGIPSDIGYQLPLSNNGYIHASELSSHKPNNFMFWTGTEFGYVQARESFGGTFMKELKPVPHYIEFYVNFANIGYDDGFGGGEGRIATNAFDLLLLNNKNQIFNSVKPYINDTDVIKVHKENTVINDTLNWIKISTCFVPKGGETFFAIGAFRDTTEILLEFSGGSYANYYGANYYFDNFAIYECDTCCLGQFPYEDHVTVSSNPGSAQNPTTFSILLNPNTTGTLTLYDSAGRLVIKEEFSQLLTTYTLPVLAKGVYQYALTTSNGVEDVGKVLVVE